MTYFEREDAIKMATPNIALNGRTIPLRIKDGFGNPIIYELPAQSMLVAPGEEAQDSDFESMENFRALLARSMGIFLPSLYMINIHTGLPLMTVGVNAYFAPQLLEAAFNVWHGVARIRDPQSTEAVIVDGKIASEYILQKNPLREMQFVLG